MEQVLVSIICTAYNHEKYIEKTIKGFLMQKTTFKYEILIHDDASTDNTAHIIKKYEKQYPELFKVIYQKENQYSQNKSPSKYLFELSNAKYFAFCEGDDYWIDEYKLQKQVDFLEKNKDFYATYHNVLVVNEENKIISSEQNAYPLYDDHVLEFSKDIMLSMIGQTASIVCRNFWKEFGQKEKMEFLCCQANGDKKYAIIFSNKGKVRYFSEIMSCYRRTYTGDSWNARTKNKNLCLFNYNALKSLSKMIENIFEKSIDIKQDLENIVLSSFIIYIKSPTKINKKIFYKLYVENRLSLSSFIYIFLKKISFYILKKIKIIKIVDNRPVYINKNNLKGTNDYE